MADIVAIAKTLSGMITTYGPTSPEVQRIILAHCRSGRAEAMLEILSETLMDQAIADKRVPYPVGIKTPHLMKSTQEAIIALCKEYLHQGGVLVAEKFVPLVDLHNCLLKFWHVRFAKPLKQHPSVMDGIPQAETIARLSIAAKAALRIVENVCEETTINGERAFVITEHELEGFCMRMAKATYEGFHRPEKMIHELAHNPDR